MYSLENMRTSVRYRKLYCVVVKMTPDKPLQVPREFWTPAMHAQRLPVDCFENAKTANASDVSAFCQV